MYYVSLCVYVSMYARRVLYVMSLGPLSALGLMGVSSSFPTVCVRQDYHPSSLFYLAFTWVLRLGTPVSNFYNKCFTQWIIFKWRQSQRSPWQGAVHFRKKAAEAKPKTDGEVQKDLRSLHCLHSSSISTCSPELSQGWGTSTFVGNGYIYACYGLAQCNLQAHV